MYLQDALAEAAAATPPEAIAVEVSVLDAEDIVVHHQGTGSGTQTISTSANRDGEGLILSRCVTGHWPACDNVALIRFVIAREPYEQEASFVLQDVPVPTF